MSKEIYIVLEGSRVEESGVEEKSSSIRGEGRMEVFLSHPTLLSFLG